MASESVGDFEQLVLLSAIRIGPGAYGMTVRREIRERAGRDVSLGAVYRTLQRLEDKGWMTSRPAETTEERNHRAKRFYRVEPSGENALRRALATLDRLRVDLPQLEPGKVHL